ncbi:LuxR C-terminal-related transcriptional regulator [Nonomuraea sp. C10]|uniref:LuxR C-terminal-related transcriptional regulator n=1 Tax=Nonomuraea sp. C10 TaxID=2600577 RepID=UPI0011CEC639|nr:helix-turn-helix transcriptional regulator [Nonomuraea sp. C10]TXK38402.1 AAA family ATPase [Nonomuraea sp. C10]
MSEGLHGRAAELDAVRLLLDAARAGDGGALVLAGPPGIGKTAVLGRAASMAGGFAVLRARGVPQESRLAGSGLHALLRPVARLVRSPVLARALRRGTAGDGMALPAAVLEFLAELAAAEPVLVCVDDLHLLDEVSREALCFAARRVAGERIALLLAVRDAAGLPEDVPVRVLEGLDPAACRALAHELAAGALPDDLRTCLARLAGGNPLAWRELVGSLTPEQLAGLAAPPTGLPPGGRLHRAHAERLARLPEATRFLLLLLAAHPGLNAETLRRRPAQESGAEARLHRELLAAGPPAVLAPAERAGLIRAAGGRYGFADETVRAVAYAEAPPARRRAAHALLGRLLDGDRHRLARAWHRAHALDGPPDQLAAELAAAASAATARGYPGRSAAYEHAAELTGVEERRTEWLAAAARHAWVSGDVPRARWLLAQPRHPLEGQAQLMRGRLELLSGHADSARDKLLTAASCLVQRDRIDGVKALLHAAEASYLTGDIRTFHAIAGQVALLRRPDDCANAQLMFEYLQGIAATFSGDHRAAAGPLRRVVRLAPAVRSPVPLVWACVASLLLGEDATALELSARAVDTARRRGAVTLVPQLLESVVQAHFWLGRYPSVAAHAAEGLRLAEASGQPNAAAQHLAWLAHADAVQGDADACRDRAHRALDLAESHGLGIAGALGTWALAHLDLAAGRLADSAARLRGHRDNDHVVVRVMASPHFIEAAARTGDDRRATAALRVLERWAGSTSSPDRRALVARCRALLAAPGEAGERFQEALELHRQGACRFETARTQLLYGGALRRERRPGAAREHLHGALETFERLGARLWSERARAELRAAGETVARPAPGGGPEQVLTPQQLRIARLVAEGATNREVAAQLFLSPRTVDHHLRNVFARLGVRSRVELARLLF